MGNDGDKGNGGPQEKNKDRNSLGIIIMLEKRHQGVSKVKVDKRYFRIQENSNILEISKKKYILHKDLEFSNKKSIQ